MTVIINCWESWIWRAIRYINLMSLSLMYPSLPSTLPSGAGCDASVRRHGRADAGSRPHLYQPDYRDPSAPYKRSYSANRLQPRLIPLGAAPIHFGSLIKMHHQLRVTDQGRR